MFEDNLHRFRPSSHFTWNVHFDGTETVHDEIIGRRGGFQKALAAVRAAKKRGFRVSTNTTVYRETDVDDLEALFAQLAAAGVDGILVAPGFSYVDLKGEIFLTRQEIMEKFRRIRHWSRRFPLISNPIYLDFVSGRRPLQCTPWGNPTRNAQGWKTPCYLITSSDRDYLPKPPTEKQFQDCCNEFWWVNPYVAKGLWRGELTYAKTMMDGVIRDEQLIKMLVWYFGIKTGFKKSPGKLGKYIKADVETEIWIELENVYCNAEFENIWKSLFAMGDLFRTLARAVAAHFGFEYPQQDDDNVSEYLRRIKNLPKDAKEIP